MFFRVVQFVCVLSLCVLAFEHIFGMPIFETIIEISHDVQQQYEVKVVDKQGLKF